MQLTRFTDYSLKVLVYLGLRPDQWITIRQISEAHGISRNHLMKVASFLAGKDYLQSQRGPGGGIRLKFQPAQIRLAAVVLDAEGDLSLVACCENQPAPGLPYCCKLRQVMTEATQAFLEVLNDHTLADLLAETRALGLMPDQSLVAQ